MSIFRVSSLTLLGASLMLGATNANAQHRRHGTVQHGSVHRGSVQHGSVHRGAVHRGAVHHGAIRHGVVQHGVVQHGAIRHGVVQHGVVQHGAIRHGVVQHGVVQHGAIRHGSALHGIVRHGTARHGIVHNNVIHGNAIHHDRTFVLPHLGAHHLGSYFVRNGGYYFSQQTLPSALASTQVLSNTSSRHTVAYPPQEMVFGGFSHVSDLASRLETLSNEFCLDLHYNYSQNRGYQETYREAHQILQTARYIHAADHAQDREAIRKRLGGLDQMLHHVQNDVRGWKRHHHKQVGQLGIQSKMDQIDSTLHHLMNDVGVRPTASAEQAPPAAERAPEPTLAPQPTLP